MGILTKPGYRSRLVDNYLVDCLNSFGAVLIEGPKWCGKTWTALNQAQSVTYLLDPSDNYNNREKAKLNPSLIFTGKYPQLIDEWQDVPPIWDAVRFDVDQSNLAGKYILTGSTTPPREKFKHSGAGRFAFVRMRPMSLFESGESSGQISLRQLFYKPNFEPFSATLKLTNLINLTVRGGWPGALAQTTGASGLMAKQYIKALINNEWFDDKTIRYDSVKLQLLLASLARNNTTMVKHSTILADIGSGNVADNLEMADEDSTIDQKDKTISRSMLDNYLEDLINMFVIEEIPAWLPNVRSKTRMRTTPKKIFVDPSLAIAALGVSENKLLDDLNTFGTMFENLCLRDLLIYAELNDGRVFHYRDNSNLEVDAIIELEDNKWGAFEIKLGEHQVESAVQNLERLKNKMIENGAEAPACLVVITGGGIGRVRDDGISVVPINSLTV